jgi:hypothetical protein
VVFLDVRKDRYFALESSRTAGLGYFVPGWPVQAPPDVGFARYTGNSTAAVLSETPDRDVLSGVISLLLEKKILISDPGEGKRAEATVAIPFCSDLTADALDERPRIGPLLFARFATAALSARLLLKYRTFDAVIERVKRRRPATTSPVAEERLLALVGAFATLRPFFFAAKDACLFDALALSEFLAGYGVFPNWVFGVQSRPFAAHCWLQLEGVVLNDTIDHVQRYTPIMVV